MTVQTEIRLSNSMANNYNSCQKKYQLAHVDKLMKATKSMALDRGITGHIILEHWAKAHVEGKNEVDALAAGMSAGAAYNMNYTMEVFPMINHWVRAIFPSLGWKILEVEKTYHAKVGEGIDGRPLIFSFTVDLLVEVGGQLVIVDHKFAADPFDDDFLILHPQLKRYIVGLRSNKVNVHHGIFNIFRTRANLKAGPETRNVMQIDNPTVPQLKEAMRTQIATMQSIDKHEGEYLRVLNKDVCTYCDFKKICLVETMGEDSTLVRQFDYRETDYGYDYE